jgi:hypothetical protein
MSPRQCTMAARADAVAKTRAAIVAAARELHAERGLVATSWDDIADGPGRRLSKAGHALLCVLCDFPLRWSLTASGLRSSASRPTTSGRSPQASRSTWAAGHSAKIDRDHLLGVRAGVPAGATLTTCDAAAASAAPCGSP